MGRSGKRPGALEVVVGALMVAVADGLGYMTWLAIDGSRQASNWWATVGLLACGALLALVTWHWFGQLGMAISGWTDAQRMAREKDDKARPREGPGGHDPAA